MRATSLKNQFKEPKKKMSAVGDYFVACIFVVCTKFLFIPMYHSTDMEVHRNWMAITYSHNISMWYFEDTSPWTLDYPPLFAWFEYGLSFAANYFEGNMLNVKNINYNSSESLFFLRISVILSDVVYILAIMKIYNILKQMYAKHSMDDPWVKPEVIFAMLMLWNPGLLLVDNIHFQYNGFLNGFLFYSIAAVMEENYLQAAIWYAILLNFKHIYLYFAPAYFVFLLRSYCFKTCGSESRVSWKDFSSINFMKLSSVVAGVFLLSVGPFLSPVQLKQILHRLFPLKRGLTHAYWAPNFWALYNTLDRILVNLNHYWSKHKSVYLGSITKGLVEEYEHMILPAVKFNMTVLLTVISILPFIWIVWKSPRNYISFLHGLVGCAFGSFMFGYHVHEKAIMMITLPLTVLAICDPVMVRQFILLSSIGHFSLFPLFYQTGETPVKIIVLLLHSVCMYTSLKHLHKQQLQKEAFFLHEKCLLAGIPIVQLFYSFGLKIFTLNNKLPFLPLMMFSSFCGLGVLYCFLMFTFISVQHSQSFKIKQKF